MKGKTKKKEPPKEVSFFRPIIADEFFNEKTQKAFDVLPIEKRILIKKILENKESELKISNGSVKTEVTFVDHMNNSELDEISLISHLKECLEAKAIRLSSEGDPFHYTDLNLKHKTLDTIFKLKGLYSEREDKKGQSQDLIELFEDIKSDEESSS